MWLALQAAKTGKSGCVGDSRGLTICTKLHFIKFIFESSGLFRFWMFHPADTAWITLVIFLFGNYVFFSLSNLRPAELSPRGISQSNETFKNPLYDSKEAAQLENKTVFLNSACVRCLHEHLCVYVWCFMIQKCMGVIGEN